MIISAHDNGYLHIGLVDSDNTSTKTFGSPIRDYSRSNFLIKLFKKLFSDSCYVEINGKNRLIDRKSYARHLQSINIMNNDYQTSYQQLMINNQQSLIHNKDSHSACLPFGTNFSNKKRDKLFTKMVIQLRQNNTEEAKRLINKGAYIDKNFYTATHYTYTDLSALMYDIKRKWSVVNFTVYTPLSAAVERNNQDLAHFILQKKGGNFSSDIVEHRQSKWKTYDFDILKISSLAVKKDEENHLTLTPSF